jgi:hypothetical protein
MKFTIDTYRANEDEVLSVYVLSDEEFEINEAIEHLADNYENHENCELVEENEPAVANHLGYKYCVVFHEELS